MLWEKVPGHPAHASSETWLLSGNAETRRHRSNSTAADALSPSLPFALPDAGFAGGNNGSVVRVEEKDYWVALRRVWIVMRLPLFLSGSGRRHG